MFGLVIIWGSGDYYFFFVFVFYILKDESRFVCGQYGCDAEWSYLEVCKMALLTLLEMRHFRKNHEPECFYREKSVYALLFYTKFSLKHNNRFLVFLHLPPLSVLDAKPKLGDRATTIFVSSAKSARRRKDTSMSYAGSV